MKLNKLIEQNKIVYNRYFVYEYIDGIVRLKYDIYSICLWSCSCIFKNEQRLLRWFDPDNYS